MELKQFVAESLVQIFEGVQIAQDKLGDLGQICPVVRKDSIRDANTIPALTSDGQPVEYFDFDVAVKIDDSNEVGAKVGISIASFNFGGSGKSVSSEGVVSKIKFRIPVVFPTK